MAPRRPLSSGSTPCHCEITTAEIRLNPATRHPPASNAAPAKALIAAFYARGLVDYLRARGVEPAALFSPAQLAMLEAAKGAAEVPLAEWIAMLHAAIAARAAPSLPAEAGASLTLRHLGVLGHVLMNCATLGEVYEQLARYIRLLGQIGQPVLSFRGHEAHLLWQWPYHSPAPGEVAQFMLAARVTFMRWLSGRSDLAFDAHFHFPPVSDRAVHARLFGGVIRYGQAQSKLVFPREYLALPVVAADEELRRQVEARAQALLVTLADESSLVHSLKAALAARLAQGRCSLQDAATALGTTARTLQRRLAAEQQHFQPLLDQVRHERAAALLREGSASLSQVAFLLGYSDQSTFQNAFKRWSGLTPGEYRRRGRRA